MGIRDTKMEAELENNIIEHLVSSQSYVYIKPDKMKISFNRKYAFDEKGLGAILTSSRAINYAYKDINSSEEEVKTAIIESFTKNFEKSEFDIKAPHFIFCLALLYARDNSFGSATVYPFTCNTLRRFLTASILLLIV